MTRNDSYFSLVCSHCKDICQQREKPARLTFVFFRFCGKTSSFIIEPLAALQSFRRRRRRQRQRSRSGGGGGESGDNGGAEEEENKRQSKINEREHDHNNNKNINLDKQKKEIPIEVLARRALKSTSHSGKVGPTFGWKKG